MRIDMGEHLPKDAVSWKVTNSTQFMLPFYKPVIQYFKPTPSNAACMSQDVLRRSLVAVLCNFPLVFARVVVQPDRSLILDYNPMKSNNPVLEFHEASVSYKELQSRGFLLSDTTKYNLDTPVLDGTFTESYEEPLLILKVSFLSDGGIALFSTRHHVLFDGTSVFSFVSHWAHCNRMLLQKQATPPLEMALPGGSGDGASFDAASFSPLELTVDTARMPKEIDAALKRVVDPQVKRTCVFSIATAEIKRLKQQTMESGILGQGKWVSSNNVLTAFLAQHVTRANMDAGTYERGPWTVFHALDMRRPLNLPRRGIGSPLFTTECLVPYEELLDAAYVPQIAQRIRNSVDRCTTEYLQDSMDWIDATYCRLVNDGVQEPWRHIWFSSLDTNSRYVGVSCMDKIPVYEADFGAGRPEMARSLDNMLNYVIVFLNQQADAYHVHVCLESPAMDALKVNPDWNKLCTLVCDS
ncbi:hypothetical protein IWW50_006104 [Coemansia erecta]|nr:hypothetical protein IWW50_006104 [Coemansia erecta]